MSTHKTVTRPRNKACHGECICDNHVGGFASCTLYRVMAGALENRFGATPPCTERHLQTARAGNILRIDNSSASSIVVLLSQFSAPRLAGVRICLQVKIQSHPLPMQPSPSSVGSRWSASSAMLHCNSLACGACWQKHRLPANPAGSARVRRAHRCSSSTPEDGGSLVTHALSRRGRPCIQPQLELHTENCTTVRRVIGATIRAGLLLRSPRRR